MILIGQFDSPFVRRVGVALRMYGMAFEHRAWSVFADTDKIQEYSPLARVPVLILDDGEVLSDSAAILDALDGLVGAGSALMPMTGPVRRHILQVCVSATGLADKAVSLVYERHVHGRATDAWVKRCKGQIERVLDHLDADRAHGDGPWWFGSKITHADIAVACAVRFAMEAHPGLIDLDHWHALKDHCDACEAMPEFSETSQPFYVAPIKS